MSQGQEQQWFRVTSVKSSPAAPSEAAKGERGREQVMVTQHWLQLPGCGQAVINNIIRGSHVKTME